MAINRVIPRRARVRYPAQVFKGEFQFGTFTFDLDPANKNAKLLDLEKETIYLIERINFSANLPEGVWLDSLQAVPPSYVLKLKTSNSPSIYPESIKTINYIDNGEQLIFFWTADDDDQLLIDYTGTINVVAATVPVQEVFVQVSFTMYQISDRNWIKWFHSNSEQVTKNEGQFF